jgi:DNA-binding FadR family transcriptional regulator
MGSRHALVAAELGRRIVSRRYPIGTVLPAEAELLREFAVSRPVLREAVKSLESKGMLEARQRRGTTVLPRDRWHLLDMNVLGWIAQSGADPDMLISLTEVRMIVEPGACRLAASVANEEALQRIVDAWERMKAGADDPGQFQEADRDFHLAILAAAGNEYLAAIGTAISAALAVSIQQTNPTIATNRATLPAHKRIIDALRKRDGAKAARESLRQLDDTLRSLLSDKSHRRPDRRAAAPRPRSGGEAPLNPAPAAHRARGPATAR